MLKFSVLFYFCLLLIFLLASAIIFALLKAFGVVGRIEELLGSLVDSDFVISGGAIFRWLFLFGLLETIVATVVTVFLAFLYNLIADVVGGVEISVSQRE